MKRILVLCLAAVLALTAWAGAMAEPEDHMGELLPDFSVNTIAGETFTLSESLQTHELVLINLWATWCGPCRIEFPYMEQAWEQYGSRVDVIALSIEPEDSLDVLRSFASDNGLYFAIGRDDANIFGRMEGSAIPTTLVVDRDRRIVAAEVGCKTSLEEFTELFDRLLGSQPPQSDTGSDRCVLRFRDAAGNPIPGVVVGFCNGEYDPVATDETGCVTFDGDPHDYHVHLLEVPAGYAMPWEQLTVAGESYDLTVTLPIL